MSRVVVTWRSQLFSSARGGARAERVVYLTPLNQLLWLGLDPRPPPPFTRTLPGTCPCPVSRSLTTTTGIHKSPLAAPHTGTHDTQIETTSHAWLISRHAARAPHPHARTMHRHAHATHIHTRSLLHPHIIGADTRTVRDPVAFGSPQSSSLRSLLSPPQISHTTIRPGTDRSDICPAVRSDMTCGVGTGRFAWLGAARCGRAGQQQTSYHSPQSCTHPSHKMAHADDFLVAAIPPLDLRNSCTSLC